LMSVDTSSGDPIGPRRWNCTLPLHVDGMRLVP
jgi:hypothetical protein